MVEFFVNELAADRYISTHLYGAIDRIDQSDVGIEDASDIFATSTSALLHNMSENYTMERKEWIQRKEMALMKQKLSPFETYVALLKGYCAIGIFVMPKAFLNGGWAASAMMEIASGLISSICVVKLVESGLKYKLYSYSLIVEKAFGCNGRFILDFMISMTQFSFALSYVAFMVESGKSTVDKMFDIDTNPWVYATAIICILTPMAWERDITKFAFTFLIGCLLIVWGLVVVSFYATGVLYEEKKFGPDIQALNTNGYLTTLGMTIYSFEGIGIVMPVMHSCENPEKFTGIFICAMVTLVITIISFSELCYLTWGSALDKPIVTEMLPSDKSYVILTKLLISINLLCTYPIVIKPANKIFEKWTFRCKNLRKKSKPRYWLKNFQRFLVVFIGAYMGVELASKIDKFLGLLGSLFCAPLALTIPSLIHLKLVAKTKSEKIIDIIIAIVSFAVLIFSTHQSISNWNDPSVSHDHGVTSD